MDGDSRVFRTLLRAVNPLPNLNSHVSNRHFTECVLAILGWPKVGFVMLMMTTALCSVSAQSLAETSDLVGSIVARYGYVSNRASGNIVDRQFYKGRATIDGCRLTFTIVNASTWKGSEDSRQITIVEVPLAKIDTSTLEILPSKALDGREGYMVSWRYEGGSTSVHRHEFTFEGKTDPVTQVDATSDVMFLTDRSAANQLANAIKRARWLCRGG